MSLYVIQFYQASPHISTASDKCWGEKGWVRDYCMAVASGVTGLFCPYHFPQVY